MVVNYKSFMKDFFKRIDSGTKIGLTEQWLFIKNKPGVLSFTEATPAFRARVDAIDDYLTFGPSNKKKVKQTLIMINKKLPFVDGDIDEDRQIKNEMISSKENIFKKGN